MPPATASRERPRIRDHHRPPPARRWLDCRRQVLSRCSNGITGINITLLDVSTASTKQGLHAVQDPRQDHDRFIPDGAELAAAEPVYTMLTASARSVRGPKALRPPDAARRYLDFIQNHVGAPIVLAGVGPGREQNGGVLRKKDSRRGAEGAERENERWT